MSRDPGWCATAEAGAPPDAAYCGLMQLPGRAPPRVPSGTLGPTRVHRAIGVFRVFQTYR